MSKDDDGGQVHPFIEFRTDRPSEVVIGISRRDWLAGLAMQGYLSAPENKFSNRENIPISQRAYKIADAMIARGNEE